MEATIDGSPLLLEYTPMQETVFLNSTAKYVICPAGRRSGKTKGACNYTIDLMLDLKDTNLLWCEVSYGQILAYFERYWLPILKQLNPALWHFDKQRRDLHIMSNTLSFRSSDRPDLIVGLGYKYVFMNEAGIQLFDNKEIWTQILSPMMLDFPDSRAFIFGTPRGLVGKDGKTNLFYEMYNKGLGKDPKYQSFKFTSYDNPLLKPSDVKELEEETPVRLRNQELFAEFLSISETQIFNPEWFGIVDIMPGPEYVYKKFISIDSAFSEKTSADESAATVWVKKWDGCFIITDCWHEQVSYPDLVTKIKAMIDTHDPDYVIVENKASGQSLIQTLRRDLSHVNVIKFPADGVAMGDKVTRAAACTSALESGKVSVLRGYWNNDLINQCTVFPLGDRDDIVDTISQGLLWAKLDTTSKDNKFVTRKIIHKNLPGIPTRPRLEMIRDHSIQGLR